MKKIFLLIVLIILQGCQSRIVVTVDSINTKEAKEKINYIILPGNQGCDESNLEYKEFSSLAEKALKLKGFHKSKSEEEADLLIYLSYHISKPNVFQYAYETPVYGQTGYASSIKSGSVNVYKNHMNYSESTTYQPLYGIIGYETKIRSEVSYDYSFNLKAIDMKHYLNSQKIVPVWETRVTSFGKSEDLRKVFPIMIYASKDYFGKNSHKKIRLQIAENDKDVLSFINMCEVQ